MTSSGWAKPFFFSLTERGSVTAFVMPSGRDSLLMRISPPVAARDTCGDVDTPAAVGAVGVERVGGGCRSVLTGRHQVAAVPAAVVDLQPPLPAPRRLSM